MTSYLTKTIEPRKRDLLALTALILFTACSARAASLIPEHLSSIEAVDLSIGIRGGLSYKPLPEVDLQELSDSLLVASRATFRECGIEVKDEVPAKVFVHVTKKELPKLPGYVLIIAELELSEPAHLVRQFTTSRALPTVGVVTWHDQDAFVARTSEVETEIADSVALLISDLAAKIAQSLVASGRDLSETIRKTCFEDGL